MKVVLDTNVWVSAWLWRGLPGQLIALARNQQIYICSSPALLAELKMTFSYEKLQQKIQSLEFTPEELLRGTEELVTVYSISELDVPELRDRDDRVVLATALAAEAD
ncbi:MAG: putative toxin-antitoxin system toxin component, PIN family, partial [Roseofilum sp. SID1]|uniref:putative toxin-antitoxin system toxin component, PIN family n=1 Tax=Roseofilum sp. SID1 TaxID=2821497 RepID=UPI001B0DF09F